MNNFERTYLESTETERIMGFHWYQDQHNYLRDMAGYFDVRLNVVCGVTAALSPMIAWKENLNMTYHVLKFKGRVPSNIKMPGLKGNIRKAIKIYRNKKVFPYLNGPKVTQFYQNLLNPFDSESVTIDTFMIACYYQVDKYGVKKYSTEKWIEFLKGEIKTLSDKYNLLPLQFQAIVWLAYHRVVGSMGSYGSQLNLKVF